MWEMVYSIPTHDELDKLLARRNMLIMHHRKFYRKMNDLRSGYSNNRIVSKKFCKWANDKYSISNMNTTLYMFYMTVDMDINNKNYHNIREWLGDNGYILDNRLSSLFSYKRFSSIESAIRWIVSYRYVLKHFRVMCKSLPTGSDGVE